MTNEGPPSTPSTPPISPRNEGEPTSPEQPPQPTTPPTPENPGRFTPEPPPPPPAAAIEAVHDRLAHPTGSENGPASPEAPHNPEAHRDSTHHAPEAPHPSNAPHATGHHESHSGHGGGHGHEAFKPYGVRDWLTATGIGLGVIGGVALAEPIVAPLAIHILALSPAVTAGLAGLGLGSAWFGFGSLLALPLIWNTLKAAWDERANIPYIGQLFGGKGVTKKAKPKAASGGGGGDHGGGH